ncbi:MAG: g-type lysozyme inhibitor [Acidobacteriota bacterium]
MKKRLLGFSVLMLVLFAAGSVDAQTTRRVQFAKGASSATVNGRIKGYEYIDYVIAARAGQTMSVRLTGSSVAELAILMPDGGNLGMDATGVREWSGELPESGDYSIRVLMPRAYARRGTTARFSMRISIR